MGLDGVNQDARRDCDYGAHRLPAGRTAAMKRKRGRLAGQAVKLFEDRLLQESKAIAPFLRKRREFRLAGNSKST